jgi:hypothetical protein
MRKAAFDAGRRKENFKALQPDEKLVILLWVSCFLPGRRENEYWPGKKSGQNQPYRRFTMQTQNKSFASHGTRSPIESGSSTSFITFLATGLAICFNLSHAANAAQSANSCQAISRAALQSCKSAAQADYFIAVGKANNIADPVARKAALQQALADKKDALAECQDQFDARQAVCDRLGGAVYDPAIDPTNFVSNITNPFMSLTPGTNFIYVSQGIPDAESNVVSVTHNTKVILGVTCVEVHDVVYVNGVLTEDTLDWFAQDTAGNVWYFGENSEELSGGLVVSLEGSWTAGVNGAKPGIVMKAQPAAGDFYRQEFSLGTAEDIAEVIDLTDSVAVPYGAFNNCLKTEETSPLEPDALEHKFYASGVGLILTVDEVTGERLELIRVTSE